MYDEGFRNITALDISDAGSARLPRGFTDWPCGSAAFPRVERERQVAIESMRRSLTKPSAEHRLPGPGSRNAEKRPGIEWACHSPGSHEVNSRSVVGDAFNLEFEDGSFDLVIDKSTTDAVSCDKDHIHENLTKMYGEAQRVLKDGGTFLVFSAVESVARLALQLPHLAFNVKEKELFLPFASLWGFEAVRGGEQRMPLDEAIRQARAADLAIAEERRLKQEAEERLKSTAPSSFGVLD
ncbi:unnamed protein product [Effrenium voratum]|uniref:Methyltransferase domain-containing protein n=1 Tax=Effrenium voratum TaxID=2562239 RepID=A0AA36NCU4_9DINO|nr:unnamed protein product [Effrenium voratum]CAJ1423345.1 unnamed protein product [Effrenium voratum]